MRDINEIILHCSDSDVAAHDDIEVIRGWHVNERGWSDVGYHYFIQSNGNIQKGRQWGRIGAHCAGRNKHTLGICLHGRDEFTQAQFDSLEELIERIELELGTLMVNGHYKYSEKTCPNFDVEQFNESRWADL